MQKHDDFSDIIVIIVENIEKSTRKIHGGVLVIAQDRRGVRLKRVNTCGNCVALVLKTLELGCLRNGDRLCCAWHCLGF